MFGIRKGLHVLGSRSAGRRSGARSGRDRSRGRHAWAAIGHAGLESLEDRLVLATGTGTGLGHLVTIIVTDPGMGKNVATSQIVAAARFADQMNVEIVAAIKATGVVNDGTFSTDDVKTLNTYIRATYAAVWATQHGSDDNDTESGFHLVKGDGGKTTLYGKAAIDTVANEIYHLGFAIDGSRIVNEDGNDNATLDSIASWLNQLLAADLASGSLKK